MGVRVRAQSLAGTPTRSRVARREVAPAGICIFEGRSDTLYSEMYYNSLYENYLNKLFMLCLTGVYFVPLSTCK